MRADLSDKTQNRIGRWAVNLTLVSFVATMLLEALFDPTVKQAFLDVAAQFSLAVLFCILLFPLLLGLCFAFFGGVR